MDGHLADVQLHAAPLRRRPPRRGGYPATVPAMCVQGLIHNDGHKTAKAPAEARDRRASQARLPTPRRAFFASLRLGPRITTVTKSQHSDSDSRPTRDPASTDMRAVFICSCMSPRFVPRAQCVQRLHFRRTLTGRERWAGRRPRATGRSGRRPRRRRWKDATPDAPATGAPSIQAALRRQAHMLRSANEAVSVSAYLSDMSYAPSI